MTSPKLRKHSTKLSQMTEIFGLTFPSDDNLIPPLP